MQYLLMLHVDEAGWPEMTPAHQSQAMAAYGEFTSALTRSKSLVANGRLAASAGAKIVRMRNGRPLVTDGPFAEAKEQVAGFYLIEAPDIEAALAWGERCPAALHGAVEVRVLG
jgi:hypothetical protein